MGSTHSNIYPPSRSKTLGHFKLRKVPREHTVKRRYSYLERLQTRDVTVTVPTMGPDRKHHPRICPPFLSNFAQIYCQCSCSSEKLKAKDATVIVPTVTLGEAPTLGNILLLVSLKQFSLIIFRRTSSYFSTSGFWNLLDCLCLKESHNSHKPL